MPTNKEGTTLGSYPLLWNLSGLGCRSRRLQERALKELKLCDVAIPSILKVVVSTFNVNGRTPPKDMELKDIIELKDDVDIYAFGFQEVVPLNPGNVIADTYGARNEQSIATNARRWDELLESHLNEDRDPNDMYYNVCCRQMVGLYITIWAKQKHRENIASVQTSTVGVGVMGYMGNKGAVAARMLVQHSPICFVCVHLSSGSGEIDHERRNLDIAEIFRRMEFPALGHFSSPTMSIEDHRTVLLFGDLNYRVSLKNDVLMQLVEQKRWSELLHGDQLSMELQLGTVFCERWREGQVRFPPSYKFVRGTNTYVGSIDDQSQQKKSRFPAWCDRILWQGNNLDQEDYDMSESQLSDHKPVYSCFHFEVCAMDTEKMQMNIEKIQRELDVEDMSRVPTCVLSPLELDFGDMEYGLEKSLPLALKNIGLVSAYYQIFEFQELGGLNPYLPKWIVVTPPYGVLEPEEESCIVVRCSIKGGIDGNAMAAYQGHGALETLLVLKIEGGRDFFLSLHLKYPVTCSLGLDLECMRYVGTGSGPGLSHRMVDLSDEGYAQACEGLQRMFPGSDSNVDLQESLSKHYCESSVPPQMLVLLQFLFAHALDQEGLFSSCLSNDVLDISLAAKKTVVMTMRTLDQGQDLDPETNPNTAAETLVAVFLALPYSFFPKVLAEMYTEKPTPASVVDVIAQVQESLSLTKWSVFCSLVHFLRSLMLPGHAERNGLSFKILANVFSQALFGPKTAAGKDRLVTFMELLLEDDWWSPQDIQHKT